jgi:hypothetical protein
MATSGEKRWPPVGRNHGHQWGEMMAADGEKQMAVDTALRCPLPLHPQGWVRFASLTIAAASEREAGRVV